MLCVLETNVQRRNGCAEITPQLQRTSTPDGTESPSLQPAGPNEAEPDETSAATQQRVEEQQALQQRQSMGAIAETSNYNKEPEEEHVEKLKEEQTDGQEEELFLDGRESLVSSGNPSDIVPPEPQYSEGQEPGLQLDMVGSCLSSETQSDTIPPVSQHIDGPVSEPALNAGEPSSLDDILFSVHQDAVGPEPEPLLDANEASSSPWSSDAIVPQVRQRTEEPMDQAESSSPDTANQREDSTNNVPLTEFLSTKDYPNRKRTRFDDLDEVTQLYSSARTRVQTDAEAHTPTHAQTRTLAHMTTQTLAHMATQTLAHVATQTLKHAEAQTDPELQPESQSAMRAKTQVRAEEQEQGQEDSNSWDSQRILQGLQATQAKQLKLQKRQIKLQHKKVKMQKAQLAMDKAREEADERRHREMLIMMATLAQDQRVIENE
ncbi:hypothetical protein BGZ54_006435 [Gamsiella multidivaricata]|nr:hypothetical protein BGZ54_006435 [Gamsiella multidivaricata]